MESFPILETYVVTDPMSCTLYGVQFEPRDVIQIFTSIICFLFDMVFQAKVNGRNGVGGQHALQLASKAFQ